MMFSNVVVICGMSIEGKGLARGTSHDEMVESFGITWLLAGTALVRRRTLVIPTVDWVIACRHGLPCMTGGQAPP